MSKKSYYVFYCCLWMCAVCTITLFATSKKKTEVETLTVDSSLTSEELVEPITYTKDELVDVTHNQVNLTLDGKKGSFGLYALNEAGKKIALLSSYDSFSSSYFMLRIGRKEYKLNYRGGAECSSVQTESGGKLSWTVNGKASVVADFSFPFAKSEAEPMDVVRVKLDVTNIGKNNQTFTLKGIFDTILGETSGIHFATNTNAKIKTQRQFTFMTDEKWVCSANKKAAIEFLLEGADISKPQYVTISSMESLQKSWVPNINEGRDFSSVASYNNSGVAINWKTLYLQPQETGSIIFYISIAEGVVPVTAGRMPENEKFLSGVKDGTYTFQGGFAPSSNADDATDTVNPVEEVKLQEEVKPVEEKVELSPAAQAITIAQLDPEYIQNLIDYIESIENSESIDEEELNSLNEELDAIFEKLRSIER